jgi:hypothetical protein
MSAGAVAAMRTRADELAAERETLVRKAAVLAADIATLNRAIAILDADPSDPTAAALGGKRAKGALSLEGVYGRGEFQRDVLEAIRTATGPVGAHDIVRGLAARKGLALDDYATRRPFEKRVSAMLSGLKARGVLVNGTVDAEGRQTYAAAS